MDSKKYLDLIPSQHYDKPNYIAWTSTALRPVGDIIGALNAFDVEFNLDQAVGGQLDIIGTYVGASRILDFQPADGSTPILQDSLYRILLRAQIIKNYWDGTIDQVVGLWSMLFPTYRIIIKDNQDMSMQIIVIGVESVLERELIERGYIAPKPSGVQINYGFPDDLIFAYVLEGEELSGMPSWNNLDSLALSWDEWDAKNLTWEEFEKNNAVFAGYDEGMWL